MKERLLELSGFSNEDGNIQLEGTIFGHKCSVYFGKKTVSLDIFGTHPVEIGDDFYINIPGITTSLLDPEYSFDESIFRYILTVLILEPANKYYRCTAASEECKSVYPDYLMFIGKLMSDIDDIKFEIQTQVKLTASNKGD